MTTTITNGLVTVEPTVVTDVAWTRTARTIIHEVLNRSTPDVTVRPTGTRAGRLQCVCALEADADALELLATAGLPLTIASDDEPRIDGLRVVVTGEYSAQLSASTWVIDLPYREVPA